MSLRDYDTDTQDWCDSHAVLRDRCGCRTAEPDNRFSAVSFADIQPRATEWVLQDLLPAAEIVVLVGEEGIGKGLWCCNLIARITTGPNPRNVLMILAEDDAQRVVRPRLDAAGADVSRVHLVVEDVETLTGTPLLPTHRDRIAALVTELDAQVLIIDPWISTVPGAISVKDAQQARQALDPMTKLARQTGVTILAVAHTNRSSGSTRDRVGLTGVLRQVARMMVLALAEPDDPSVLWVGVEKSNLGDKPPAARYVKAPHAATVRLESDNESRNTLTIEQIDSNLRRQSDGRSTDKWTQLVQASDDGIITRAQIEDLYADAPHPTKSADKAIERWVPERLRRVERGVFEVIA